MSAEIFLTELLKNNETYLQAIEPKHKEWMDRLLNIYEEQGKDIVPVLKAAAVDHALKDFRQKFIDSIAISIIKLLEEHLLGKENS